MFFLVFFFHVVSPALRTGTDLHIVGTQQGFAEYNAEYICWIQWMKDIVTRKKQIKKNMSYFCKHIHIAQNKYEIAYNQNSNTEHC